MVISIYQIKNLASCKYAFRDYEEAVSYGEFNLNDYECVYIYIQPSTSANMQKSVEDLLEEVFFKFNVDRPNNFTGHSLSVSDIVDVDGVKYYVDPYGFAKI